MLKYTQALTLGLIFSILFLAGCEESSLVEADRDAASSDPIASQEDVTLAKAAKLSEPVEGTANGQTFQAVFNITKFKVVDGQIVAIGFLTDITGLPNTLARRLAKLQIELPLTGVTAPDPDNDGICDILFLQLGPLDLELLGLIVHIDQIVIDIDADPSAGILGDILCALADGFAGNLLQQVVNLLNDILSKL